MISTAQGKTLTITARVRLWLQEVEGGYCDQCLARELGLDRKQATTAARALARKSNFARESAICSLCGAERKVIEVLWTAAQVK